MEFNLIKFILFLSEVLLRFVSRSLLESLEIYNWLFFVNLSCGNEFIVSIKFIIDLFIFLFIIFNFIFF